MKRFLFALWLVALPALAGETPPAPSPLPAPGETPLAYGKSHADCAEWTDSCIVCKRAEGTIACSTPGVACVSGETICRAPALATEPPAKSETENK
ncbi:MAG: hypothetical protein KGL46_06345 [Hyphomicrobiales bacterium]|nr:hypothetical protein [Hyphomicrobiales bacterium]